MGNCTGIVYGLVKGAIDGMPISGVDVDVNWIQKADGGPLKIGGNDGLTEFVPKCKTTKAGEYAIPFYWASEQAPGYVASARAVRWKTDNAADSLNIHGQLGTGLDVKKLISVVFPPIPTSPGSAGGMFLSFYTAATPELKGMGILTRFIGSSSLFAIELQGVFSRIDFSF